MGRLGIFDQEDVAWLTNLAENGSYDGVKSRRAKLVATVYEDQYLQTTRYAREQAGVEG